MNRMIATMVLAAAALTGTALHAATPNNNTYTVPNPSHEKMVSFQLRNSTAAPLKVKAGEAEMTLQPGKLTSVKMPVGTQIVAVGTTAHYAEGSVLAVVSTALADATITLQ